MQDKNPKINSKIKPEIKPKVAVVMGSQSDNSTMQEATNLLEKFSIACENRILSAHRTPQRLREYAQEAEDKGIEAIIAGAGGAAHLPGMLAAETLIPVLGVPIGNSAMRGLDSFLSIAQMPRGVPVATFSIDGAKNAALFAVSMLARKDASIKQQLQEYRNKQTESVPNNPTAPIANSNGASTKHDNGVDNKNGSGDFGKFLTAALLLYLGYDLLKEKRKPTNGLSKGLSPNEPSSLSGDEMLRFESALRQAKDIYSE